MKNNTELICFYDVSSFLDVSDEFSNLSEVYIDSNLGNNIIGEIESEKIANKGFKNIHLTTGYASINLEDYPWIVSLTSKKPPF